MVNVIVIRSNSIKNDTRVRKICGSLSKRYDVKILGWNREGVRDTTIDSMAKTKLFNLKAPIGKISLIFYYPFFWLWVFLQLISFRPKIVHACDLDTIPPSLVYKFVFRKKLIFDVFDRYAMAYIPKKLKFIFGLVNILEEFSSSRSDALITVSEELSKTFRKKSKICSIVMNCPNDDMTLKKSTVSKDTLWLVYTGNIVRNRGLEVVSEAINDIEGIQFVFAGRVIDDEFLDELLLNQKIHYRGFLTLNEALILESQADIIVVLYDPNNPQNKFAMPNKIFISMMFGIPTITNLCVDLITENKCGLVVNYYNIDGIKHAILKLRDDVDLRKELGCNGRKSFIQKFNWGEMEKKLFNVYNFISIDDSSRDIHKGKLY